MPHAALHLATDEFYNTRHPSARYSHTPTWHRAARHYTKPVLNAFDTEVWSPPSHFLADTNCDINARVQYHLASGFEDTRLTEEQPQQLTACYLGLGSNAAQKKSKHPRSGYGSFLPLIKQGPQEHDALRIQASLQHSASDEGAKVIWYSAFADRDV